MQRLTKLTPLRGSLPKSIHPLPIFHSEKTQHSSRRKFHTTTVNKNLDQTNFDQQFNNIPDEEVFQVARNINENGYRLRLLLLMAIPLGFYGVMKIAEWLDEKFNSEIKGLTLGDLDYIFENLQSRTNQFKEKYAQFNLKLGSLLSKEGESISEWVKKDFERNKIVWALYSMHFVGACGCIFMSIYKPTQFLRFYDRHLIVTLNNLQEMRFHTLILSQFAHNNVLSFIAQVFATSVFTEVMTEKFSKETFLSLYFGMSTLGILTQILFNSFALRYNISRSPMTRMKMQYLLAKAPFQPKTAALFAGAATFAFVADDLFKPYIGLDTLQLSYIFFGSQFLLRWLIRPESFISGLVAFYGSYLTLREISKREPLQKSRIMERDIGSYYYLGEEINSKRSGKGILLSSKRKEALLGNFKDDQCVQTIKKKPFEN